MEEQGKADSTFLYPKTSPSSSHAAPDFPICPIAQEIGLNNLGTSRQVAITQIYVSRKIKHPSFRKRASSGSMPYYIPFRHRQRTKSENADGQTTSQQPQESRMDVENVNEKIPAMDMGTESSHLLIGPLFNKIKMSQLKKSKSMESLLSLKLDEKDSKVGSSSTLEFVSSLFIQKLKFNE